MLKYVPNKSLFKFQYIPDYAKFLLENKLEEFTLVGIRFARELDLPMMRPLAKMPEKELVQIALESNKEILESLANNSIENFIEKNISQFVENRINDNKGKKLIDKTDVAAEDIILAFYIRRKVFTFFLHSYTQNAVIHVLIASEVDAYTTNEHLLTSMAYIRSLQEQSSPSSAN